jgi:hypothetical protein
MKWGVGGYVHVPVDENDIIFEIDFGDVPLSILRSNDVETIVFDWCSEYHGTKAALVAAGVAEEGILRGKKPSKSNGHNTDERRWWRFLQPDGMIVFGIESELSWRRREKERERERQRPSPLLECEVSLVRRLAQQCESADEWKRRLDYLLGSIPITTERVLAHLGQASDRFQLDSTSALRIREILARTHTELSQAFVGARVLDSQRTKLRLIVDNSQ